MPSNAFKRVFYPSPPNSEIYPIILWIHTMTSINSGSLIISPAITQVTIGSANGFGFEVSQVGEILGSIIEPSKPKAGYFIDARKRNIFKSEDT